MTTRTKAAYDRWADNYDSDPNPQTTLERADVLEMIAANRQDYILDAACGTGFYTAAFCKQRAKVIGVDFSAGMLRQARQRCPKVTFKKADLNRKLPFSKNTFTKINCAQALKHVKNLRGVFKEFSRILRPAGVLTFSVTHPEMKWDGYEMRKTPKFILSQESDIFHYGFTDYLDAIEAADLKVHALSQIPIGPESKHFLTRASYNKVKGRFQVVVFQVRKE